MIAEKGAGMVPEDARLAMAAWSGRAGR